MSSAHEGDRTPRERPKAFGFTPQHNDGERPGLGLPTFLREMGRNAKPLQLSLARRQFMLGGASSPEVDVTLDGDGVSRLHAILIRRGNKIEVRDQSSTNGTYFRGARDNEFQIGIGDTFQVTQRITLLVLDDDLEALRDTMQWAMGLHADGAIDAALEHIARPDNALLLLGPSGCDQRELAEAIHDRSTLRARDFVMAPSVFSTREEQDAKLAHGARSTVYLDLIEAGAFPHSHFVSGLFAGSIRPIVAARDVEQARELLGEDNVNAMKHIAIPPLRARRDDIPTMLDALLLHQSVTRKEPPLPRLSAKLDAASIAGLRDCDWDASEEGDNMDALRSRAVPRLHALLKHNMQLGRAARSLGLKHTTTLRQALERMGVRVHQAQEPDEPEAEAGATKSEEPPLPRPPVARHAP